MVKRFIFLVLATFPMLAFADINGELSSELYNEMSMFCMSKEYIDATIGDDDISDDSGFNPVKGYNPSLEKVEQYRARMMNLWSGAARDASDSFYFALRGALNLILDDLFKALGDYSEAKRVCPSAPVGYVLSMLYRELGDRRRALEFADAIPCNEREIMLCSEKVASLILLMKYEKVKTIVNSSFYNYSCIPRMVVELLEHGSIDANCRADNNDNIDDAGIKFSIQLIENGFSNVNYSEFYNDTNIEDMNGFGKFFLALHEFRQNRSEGCETIEEALNINATAKKLLPTYELAREISEKICDKKS